MHQKLYKIAALACSHNRVEKTIQFLKSLFNQKASGSYTVDVFILDDNSSDGTPEKIKECFPSINLIHGSGTLFWAGGMRKVWRKAMEQDEYDLYLLLNDDVKLFENALSRLVSAYTGLHQEGGIIIGTTISAETGEITYGGNKLLTQKKPFTFRVVPDATGLINCEVGNANVMLVDAACVNSIGIFSDAYTHGIADYDYTLMAARSGLRVSVAPGYFGYCENDHMKSWLAQTSSLSKRIKHLYSPKGLAYDEYRNYIRKHFPAHYPSAVFKLWVKTIFPIVYTWFKKKKDENRFHK